MRHRVVFFCFPAPARHRERCIRSEPFGIELKAELLMTKGRRVEGVSAESKKIKTLTKNTTVWHEKSYLGSLIQLKEQLFYLTQVGNSKPACSSKIPGSPLI
jgi:hypothetical protein